MWTDSVRHADADKSTGSLRVGECDGNGFGTISIRNDGLGVVGAGDSGNPCAHVGVGEFYGVGDARGSADRPLIGDGKRAGRTAATRAIIRRSALCRMGAEGIFQQVRKAVMVEIC